MIDFHSHFLPCLDDGAESLECALEMLEDLRNQGVSTVVSTSHFYEPHGSVECFLNKRQASYESVKRYINEKHMDVPGIVLGAEVALTPDIPQIVDLEKLCIGDTNTILIELPYNGYYEWINYAIYDIISKRELVPVLAHFERFCTDKFRFEKLETLLSLEVKVQINTDSILNWKSFKMIKRLAKMGKIDVIGSDAHNMTTRRSTFAQGVKRFEKRFGKDYLELLDENAKNLIGFN